MVYIRLGNSHAHINWEFSVLQIEYPLGSSSKKGSHVYFLLIVAMVLLLWRHIVLLWHQVTMVASEPHFWQNNNITQKTCNRKYIHDYLFCYCPLVAILFEVLRITITDLSLTYLSGFQWHVIMKCITGDVACLFLFYPWPALIIEKYLADHECTLLIQTDRSLIWVWLVLIDQSFRYIVLPPACFSHAHTRGLSLFEK